MRRGAVTFALSVGALVFSLPVHAAGLTRTFVSSTGVDTNPCTTAAPCASFAVAYAAVAPNGIVAALDPGKYGSLNIMGPVTIDGNGWAAITAPVGGNGVSVNAGPTDNVILRGLTIDGANAAAVSGIVFNRGGSLTVTGCVVRNIGGGDDGLDAFNTGSSAMALTVSDSAFINNAGNGIFLLRQGSGALAVSITRTEVSGNGFDGIDADGSAGTGALALTVAVSDSVLANNVNAGIGADSINTATTSVAVTATQLAGNAIGVAASDNATVWLAQSTVANNATGYSAPSSGIINSYGDNYFANNGAGSGTFNTIGKQ
jgi:hypothetical protein